MTANNPKNMFNVPSYNAPNGNYSNRDLVSGREPPIALYPHNVWQQPNPVAPDLRSNWQQAHDGVKREKQQNNDALVKKLRKELADLKQKEKEKEKRDAADAEKRKIDEQLAAKDKIIADLQAAKVVPDPVDKQRINDLERDLTLLEAERKREADTLRADGSLITSFGFTRSEAKQLVEKISSLKGTEDKGPGCLDRIADKVIAGFLAFFMGIWHCIQWLWSYPRYIFTAYLVTRNYREAKAQTQTHFLNESPLKKLRRRWCRCGILCPPKVEEPEKKGETKTEEAKDSKNKAEVEVPTEDQDIIYWTLTLMMIVGLIALVIYVFLCYLPSSMAQHTQDISELKGWHLDYVKELGRYAGCVKGGRFTHDESCIEISQRIPPIKKNIKRLQDKLGPNWQTLVNYASDDSVSFNQTYVQSVLAAELDELNKQSRDEIMMEHGPIHERTWCRIKYFVWFLCESLYHTGYFTYTTSHEALCGLLALMVTPMGAIVLFMVRKSPKVAILPILAMYAIVLGMVFFPENAIAKELHRLLVVTPINNAVNYGNAVKYNAWFTQLGFKGVAGVVNDLVVERLV